MSFQRPTSLGAAFMIAACSLPKVDHQRGTGNWVARRTLLNAERPGFAVVKEFDRGPRRPSAGHGTSLSTPKLKEAITAGLEEVFMAAAVTAYLEDDETHGID